MDVCRIGARPFDRNEWDEETEYNILQKDEQGNWTKRIVCTTKDYKTWKYTERHWEIREINYRN
jgi:hypothetical protein